MKAPFLDQILADLRDLPGTSVFHVSVKSSLAAGQVDETIQGILEQSQSHRPAVSRLVGEDLLQKIESLCTLSSC